MIMLVFLLPLLLRLAIISIIILTITIRVIHCVTSQVSPASCMLCLTFEPLDHSIIRFIPAASRERRDVMVQQKEPPVANQSSFRIQYPGPDRGRRLPLPLDQSRPVISEPRPPHNSCAPIDKIRTWIDARAQIDQQTGVFTAIRHDSYGELDTQTAQTDVYALLGPQKHTKRHMTILFVPWNAIDQSYDFC